MPSSYTTRNRAEKQGVGENSNAWGGFLNSDTIDMFDEALDGVTSFTLSTTKTLTTNNGATDEARKRVLNITGGSGGTVTIPNLEKTYLVRNASSGNVIFTTGTGTTATVSSGAVVWIFCDGANAVLQEVQPISAGGTGATTASGARTNLGLAIGTNVQAYNANLAAVAGLTSAADSLPYFTGSGTAAVATFTAAGRALVDDVDAAAQRTTLGLGTMATQNANNVTITGGSISSLGAAIAIADGGTGASSAASARSNLGVTATGADTAYAFRANNLSDLANAGTARTNLGLGTMATQAASAVAITGGTVVGITDITVADGGTGASTAAAARSNLSTPHAIAMFCGGVPGASEQIGGMISPWTFTITQANCSFKAGTAATASTTITIKNNGSSIGTAVFAISGTTATVTITTAAVTAGDLITFHAPASPDASLADISGLLKE